MLTLGALFVCGAVLAFAALTLVFRRPAPPRWTTWPGVGDLVTVTLVSLLTFGIGYLAAGAIAAYQGGVDPIDLGLLVVVLVGTVAVWRRLDPRRRLRLMERPVAAGAAAPVVSPDPRMAAVAPEVAPQSYPAERAA